MRGWLKQADRASVYPVLPALFLVRNTFQLAMGSDVGGRTFASVCYDNLLWLYASYGTAVLPVAAFTDGVSSSVLLSGADSAATFLNMTCMGTAGLSNGA